MHLILPKPIQKRVMHMDYEENHVGCSQAGVYKFSSENSVYYLKVEPKTGELEKEYRNLQWLQGKLPVPQVIEWVEDASFTYLLLSEINGKMICDDYYLQDPSAAVRVLAEGINCLRAIDIKNCPIHNELSIKLRDAAENIRLNRVDMEDWESGTAARNFASPQALWEELCVRKPTAEDLSFTHGDYCLPNVFGSNHRLSGFIDMGRAGLADIWQDIALCIRSLWHNFGTNRYDHMLLDQIGIPLNPEKLDYYILLDELF